MADRWLKEVGNVDGVDGVFLANGKGNILGKLGHLEKDSILEKLTIHMLRIIAAFHLEDKNASEIEFYWEDRYVIAKHSGNFLLVTFCKSINILSLLRITLNVAMANILEDKKMTKTASKHVADKVLTLKRGVFDDSEKILISKLK
ncbi:MAG TPA: hypothetical protein EYP36_11655 [Calditrichaeota bacterium]|nr:hypothetical protein [Calditrichota bacterium]